MELVYLWVEEYKNIKNQGFNFSPRFECEFDGENLTIDENKDYVSIFPENINVTAIVGENGSGKSTILEIISNIVLEIKSEKEIILIFVEDNKLLYTNYKIGNIINTTAIREIYPNNQEKLLSVYYSSNFTNGNINSILELFTTPSFKTHNKSDLYYESHGYNNSNFKNQSLLNLLLNSSRLLEAHPSESSYRNKHSFTIIENLNNYENSKIICILNFLRQFGKEYLGVDFKTEDILKVKFNFKANIDSREHNLINQLKLILDKPLLFTGVGENDEETYQNNINENKYYNSRDKFLSFLLNKIEKDIHTYQDFNLSLDDSIKFMDYYLELYIFNKNLQKSIFEFSFKNLSSGEENKLLLFALLERGIASFLNEDKKSYSITIMLDEIENTLHPNWQKRIIIKLFDFLRLVHLKWKNENNYYIKFHIIMSSHSPFILSDLPKENVIFLEKYKKEDPSVINEIQKIGNCKNVSDKIDINQTFGANIHTLLSHGFFMSDGLMGEFAKSKIEEIKKFHELVKKCEKIITKSENVKNTIKNIYQGYEPNFRNIQNIIGEPFLKTIIGNYLDELEQIFNNDTYKNKKRDNLLKQFSPKELEEYLESLKNAKN